MLAAATSAAPVLTCVPVAHAVGTGPSMFIDIAVS